MSAASGSSCLIILYPVYSLQLIKSWQFSAFPCCFLGPVQMRNCDSPLGVYAWGTLKTCIYFPPFHLVYSLVCDTDGDYVIILLWGSLAHLQNWCTSSLLRWHTSHITNASLALVTAFLPDKNAQIWASFVYACSFIHLCISCAFLSPCISKEQMSGPPSPISPESHREKKSDFLTPVGLHWPKVTFSLGFTPTPYKKGI